MEKLTIAIIKRSHGVKGLLRIKSLSGETNHFISLKKIFIRREGKLRGFVIENIKVVSKDNLLIKLEGIDSPEAARGIIGKEILVDRKYAAPLKSGEYYIADLCQCNVFKKDELIGHVKSVIGAGYNDLLEVSGVKGETLMIPFIGHFVFNVDVENKKIMLTQNYEKP